MRVPRNSKQRDTIRTLLLGSERPLDSGEVLRQAQARVPTLGLSTVYRVLRELQLREVIRPLIGPGQKLYYEAAESPEHHHSFCRHCQRAFCVRATIDVDAMVPAGFVLERQVLYLFGYCRACAEAQPFDAI